MQGSLKTECPDCEGKGYMIGFGCPGFKPMKLPCTFCHETGLVTGEDLKRKEEGQRMRNERVDRRVSLREEAARLGIKPSELADRERGIVRKP